MTAPAPAGEVAYLGPPGTFTHGAAQALCPDATLVPVATQADAVARLGAGEVGAVVLPVDNSMHGAVLPTWDAILDSADALVVDDVVVPVSFHALTRDRDVPATSVVSHPHALAQCSAYIDGTGLPTRATSSTAEACRTLEPGQIAIAAPVCGPLYDLDVLATEIEDVRGAATQFALLARAADARPRPTTADSISVVAVLPAQNRAGALLRVLEPFRAAGLNLVNVIARPIAHSDSEFMFLLHVKGLDDDGQHAPVLDEVRAGDATVVSLGRLQQQVKHVQPVPRQVPRRLRAQD